MTNCQSWAHPFALTCSEADTSDLAIHEVAQEGDITDSDESTGADANDFMAAAGQEVARVHSQRDSFIAALTNLVSTFPPRECPNYAYSGVYACCRRGSLL